MSRSDAVLVTADGPVRIVTLNRPDTLNATDAELHRAITEVWGRLADDTEARAVVLTGAGKAFSAGGDFGLLQAMVDDTELRTATIDEGKILVQSMLALEVPIVGAVNGPAVGLGCSLTSLCDLVLMAEDAYLSDPHAVLGLVAADGGGISWPFLTGLLRAKEHLLLGSRISAADAVAAGLATRVSPDPLTEAVELAHRIADAAAAVGAGDQAPAQRGAARRGRGAHRRRHGRRVAVVRHPGVPGEPRQAHPPEGLTGDTVWGDQCDTHDS